MDSAISKLILEESGQINFLFIKSSYSKWSVVINEQQEEAQSPSVSTGDKSKKEKILVFHKSVVFRNVKCVVTINKIQDKADFFDNYIQINLK